MELVVVYGERVRRINTSDHYSARAMQTADLQKLDPEKMLAFYTQAFTNAANFTFFFVGTFTVEGVTPLLEQSARWVEYLALFLAGGYALIGRRDEALRWLKEAVRLGFINYPFFTRAPFLESLRGDAEFQALLDFPPAPKLAWDGRLDPSKASEAELRGQEVFFGKGKCSTCHTPPYYTDNLMHNLRVERFFKEKTINGRLASADGPIKTFPLRGIKDSPPYLHDDRLLTLDDTVEFFNLVLETRLSADEKKDLVAFLRQL